MSDEALCLLHIGKTGGSFLKAVLKHNNSALPSNLKLLRHGATLANTRNRFGPGRRLAFVFREPTERFVSAFNSRLRQGRPTYQSGWSAEEATAFLWFNTPNDLAEGLASTSERVKSAAFFAMNSITHLARNYAHYLGGVEVLRKEDCNIHLCIELNDLDANLPKVLTRLGVIGAEIPQDAMRHADPARNSLISSAGVAALHEFWAEEYRIYDYLRSIVRI